MKALYRLPTVRKPAPGDKGRAVQNKPLAERRAQERDLETALQHFADRRAGERRGRRRRCGHPGEMCPASLPRALAAPVSRYSDRSRHSEHSRHGDHSRHSERSRSLDDRENVGQEPASGDRDGLLAEPSAAKQLNAAGTRRRPAAAVIERVTTRPRSSRCSCWRARGLERLSLRPAAGDALRRGGGAAARYEKEASEQAIAKYRAAMAAWKRSGDKRDAARAGQRIGATYAQLGSLHESLQALPRGPVAGRRRRGRPSARERDPQRRRHRRRPAWPTARSGFEEARQQCQTALDAGPAARGGVRAEAKALNCLGEVAYYRQQPRARPSSSTVRPDGSGTRLGDRRGQAADAALPGVRVLGPEPVRSGAGLLRARAVSLDLARRPATSRRSPSSPTRGCSCAGGSTRRR